MDRLVTVTALEVKGAHDAEMVIVDNFAYIVAECSDERSGESARWPEIYASLSIVNIKNLKLEEFIPFARGEQQFENNKLPVGACFVPRIIQKDDDTLRCFFASEDPGNRQSQTWYRDFDLRSRRFSDKIFKVKLKTRAGVFDMQPQYFHADAVADDYSFRKPAKDYGLYIFDSFKRFDGKLYVAINNFVGKQNALATLNDEMDTFEIVGHYNEPQEIQLSESSVNRLPNGNWIAICRQDGGNGNYYFTESRDGKVWTWGRQHSFVSNGTNSKPTFDFINGLYYLGWQENTEINGAHRSVFNVDVSRDCKTWERKYRFESENSFQYPTFREYDGAVYLTVTQGDTSPSRKERIMFGKLEDLPSSSSSVKEPRNKENATLSTSPQYNVLFIVADDMNCDLGSYGHPNVKTPNIDKLASQGIQFDRAYCQYPLCGPSRASFLSGLRPDTTGVYVHRYVDGRGIFNFREIRPNTVTLPETFKNAGTHAIRIGKLFHHDVPKDIGTSGKDDEQSWTQIFNPIGHDKEIEDEIFKFKGDIKFSWHSDDSGEPQTDEIAATKAIEFLEQYQDEAFFLAVGFFRPHWPYIAPKEYFDLYPLDEIELYSGPGLFEEGVPESAYASRWKGEEELTDKLKKETKQAYYASISFVDAQVGRLLDAVESLGLKENTIIVFLSDHGYHMGEQGLWRKKSLWEPSARVPLIISVPNMERSGVSSSRTVELVDLYATITELCGLEGIKSDGESLVPLLKNPNAIWPYPAFTQMQRGHITITPVPGIEGDFMGRSVRTERWRYIQWGENGIHGEQLYDMKKDPKETRNLADEVAHERTIEKMKSLLLSK